MNSADSTAYERGFSLVEMLVAMLLLLIISGTAFQALSYYQKSYLSTQIRVDMQSAIRGAIELVSQEIGQAGTVSFAHPRKLYPSGVFANASPQSVALDLTTDIFVGEKLLIDAGPSQELVSVTAVSGSSITGIFLKDHAASAPVNVAGMFPYGVLPALSSSGYPYSSPTRLQLFGDIYGDGTLMFVEYDCNAGTVNAPGTFTRSITPVSENAIRPAKILIANVIPNPGGTQCFQYTQVSITNVQYVTAVAITITVQTAQRDPQTRQFIALTKSFLNIAPRNLLASIDDANSAIIGRLQPLPPNLPLH